MGKYDDIINLPHHVSKIYPQMSLEARAAQFAPFAALTGYEGQIKETARLTNNRIDLDEELKSILDSKLQEIQDKLKTRPRVEFTYFIPDSKKDGGKYVTVAGIIKKIDEYKQVIVLENKQEIPIQEIIDISIIEDI